MLIDDSDSQVAELIQQMRKEIQSVGWYQTGALELRQVLVKFLRMYW